jgi:hypothetical protein
MPRFTGETAREARRKGGKARAARCDMKALGAKGGKATHAKYGSEHMARIGHRGALSTARKYGYTFLFHLTIAKPVERPWQPAKVSDVKGAPAASQGSFLEENVRVRDEYRSAASPSWFLLPQ